MLAYRTVDSLDELTVSDPDGIKIMSTRLSPEKLLHMVLDPKWVNSTLFYMQGETDAERVSSWARTIDEQYRLDMLGIIYVGTAVSETAAAKTFNFRRLKTTRLNDSWIRLGVVE